MKNLAIILLFLCTTHLSAQSPLDIDLDDDGLIEINDLETLNAMRYQLDGSGLKMSAESTKTTTGCATGGCIGYELTTNLDFLDDASYSSTANKIMWTVIDYEDSTDNGWQPIGSFIDQFITAFEGNNHTISNLMINRTGVDYVGLFGYVGSGAEIANIGLLNVNIVGYDFVSGLIGYSEGNVMNGYVTGTVEGASEVGGLVGLNEGSITNSYATSAVEGNEEGMGGLVGRNDGNIANSYATGAVEGNEEGVGGLVGRNEGNIANSYATGAVEGDADVGGLAGIQGGGGSITNSYAAGTVTGKQRVGGLAGSQWVGSNITNSYATGTVTGKHRVGGLVGSQWFGGNIANSYAAGAVLGDQGVGGLVGIQWYGGNITNSYASGAVLGDQGVGGLVGSQAYRSSVINSYASGTVAGNQRIGGLIGYSSGSSMIKRSYWDKTTSGIETSDGGEAKTTAELQSPTNPATTQTEVYYNWSESDWDFGTNQQYPISKYTLGDENNPACQSPTDMLNLPICGYPLLPITRYGLIDVRLVEGNLSPDFMTTDMHYTGTVVSSVSAVQLIPTAVDPEAEISIIVNNEKESIKSGATSTVITLAADATTDIILEVMNSATTTRTVEYTLRLKYYHYGGGDVDKDNDGLIEISDLEGLNAMRYQLDGTGYRKSANTPKITVGCAVGGCNGYELTTDLDFLAEDSYSSAVNKAEWTVESYKDRADNGWQPIGDFDNQFIAFFEGNNHTISNLMINRPSVNYIGLFGYAESATRIVNISLSNVRIVGRNFVGSLVGFIKASSSIANSYAMGEVKGGRKVGGLVGHSEGNITNSYAAVEVKGRREIGGLVGHSESNIINSYATGAVQGRREIGGLVGWAEGNIMNSYASGAIEGDSSVGGLVGMSTASSIINSYWDTDTSGIETSDGGEAKTTDDLQLPTTPTDTIYLDWRTTDWDFGSSAQYPILKYTIGDDRTNPACGVSQQPGCGTLLQRQRNHQPRITYPTSATQIEILASDPTTKTIDVTVIDEDVRDNLTILLLAGEGQTLVGLITTTAEILSSGSAERELSLKIRIPTRTVGSIAELRLIAEDDSGFENAMSEPIAFKVAVLGAGNTPPTITLSAPSEIRLSEEASTTLNVAVMDADNDSLTVSVRSDNDAIATATIVATDGATRTLKVMSTNAGTATITVTVDDGGGESNSKASVTFMVIVEENTAPSLRITSPTDQNLQLGEMSPMVVFVSDNNFDVGDMVTVTVSTLPSSVVAIVSTEEIDITQDTTISFILNAINAGTAAITITATDHQGETTSTTLNVHVNAPPEIVGYDEEVSVVIDRVRNINIVVSDVNIDDELTLTLSVAEMGRALVQLATTSVTVIANGMAQQTPVAITGLQPGVTTLTVVVSDGREGKTQKHIKIIVRPHVTPMIDANPPFADIVVLPKTDRVYTIMVNDRDYDVPGSLEVEVLSSSTPTVAVELEDTTTTGTYSLILTSQSVLSSATITVRVNDNKGEMAIVTFNVNVVANQSPSLTITPSTDPIRNLQLNSTASLMIVVSDVNYDMGDAVTIKVVATPSSVVLVEPTEITGITSIDIQKIMLDAVASGNAAITITATDRLGASTSTTIAVYVHDRSVMVAIAASDANEGETVLIEPMISGANEDRLSYQWRVIAGTTTTGILQRVMMATSTLSFRIADDYIKDTSNQNATQELQIELVVTEQTTDPISVLQTVMVTITKKDNDNADLGTIIVDPDNSRSLSFPELDLASDSDGEIATNTIVYQWQKYNMEGSNWEDISSAMSRSYPIAVTDTSGDRFRVSVTYTDGQGYTKTLHSNEYTYGRSIMVRTKVFLEGPLR